jgi:DUF1680 family protein
MRLRNLMIFLSLVIVAGASAMSSGPVEDGRLKAVPFTDVQITEGFWADRIKVNRDVTVRYCFEKCEQTGRISNFAKAGGLMDGDFEGIYFNDSDLYKVIEGAAYSLTTHPDEELEEYVDGVIDKIAAAQWEDGYLYTHYSVPKREAEKRWTNVRDMHELYCAGHFFEAAVAYYQATGKRKILDVAIGLADYIDSVFGENAKIDVPGHQEIEIGLVKLYQVTGQERYLKLAKSFLDWRGRSDLRKIYGQYHQDHLPVAEQTRAVGHAVRAGYMYAGMADVAALTGDEGYVKAIDTIWENVVSRRQYVTGGVGARHGGEAFGEDYELPNTSAYNETCAAIANAMWNHRLFLLHEDAKYIDVLERVIYNGFLSGVSLEGNKFFYPNPLECRGGYERSEWFGCSCCPVNVVRFVPSIPGYMYAVRCGDVYVNLFAAGRAAIETGRQKVELVQKTKYPWEGKVRIEVEPEKKGRFSIYVRIPGWARGEVMPGGLYEYMEPGDGEVVLKVNGEKVELDVEGGFVRLERKWRKGDVIELDIPMPIRRVLADESVKDDVGRAALERGPIVYCAEGVDNGGHVRNLVLADDAELNDTWRGDLLGGVVVLKGRAVSVSRADEEEGLVRDEQDFKAVPYYSWAHRDAGEMTVWLAREEEYVKPLPGKTITSTSRGSASHCLGTDTASALNDQEEPESSNDHEIARHTWWDHKGTAEWVQYDFENEARVAGVEVYWFDDTGAGACRVPKSWRVLYKDGSEWKAVKEPSGYGVLRDEYNKVDFEPVQTDGLRLEVQLQDNFSGGILEWRVNEAKGPIGWPGVEDLPEVEELPDVFLMLNGSRVETVADWARRREEIKAMLLYYEYGHMPPGPGNVEAQELWSEIVYGSAGVKERLLLSMGPGHSIKVNVQIIRPVGEGPFAAIVRNGGELDEVAIAEEIIKRGYVIAEYVRTDLDPDKNDIVGSAQTAYPDYDWATLAVWAWGGMRVIDYLETLDYVDKERIAFTGHSRGGKTALLAGALDERIALTVPNGSGCGGSGCYRVMGKNAETLDDITKAETFSYWFAGRFRDFAGRESRLPFDQHFLKALVAPRVLLTTDALGDLWANPYGTQVTQTAAKEVFDFLGAGDKIGMHFREGGHSQNEEDFRALVDFAEKVFYGREVEREFVPAFTMPNN